MELPIEIDGNLDPEPSRPRMFGDYAGSAELPWEWATERLSKTRNYWIATTRPAGQPHSRPVWGVWLDTTFYFSTGSLAAQNLAVRPHVTFGWHFDESEINRESTALGNATRWRFRRPAANASS